MAIELPRGRLMYGERDDAPPYALYRYEGEDTLWISGGMFWLKDRAAGPVAEHDAVRALRLANIRVPDGCERGPWEDGIAMLGIVSLPHERYFGWDKVDPSTLPPSFSSYADEDITGAETCSCCAPPRYPPRVLWEMPSEPRLAQVQALRIDLRNARVGTLKKMWNAHPRGSIVWAPRGELEKGFVIADIEST